MTEAVSLSDARKKLVFRDEVDKGTWADVVAGLHLPPDDVLQEISATDYRPIIVDLGCHAGYTILDWLSRWPDALIYACDASRANVDQAWATVEAVYGEEVSVQIFHQAIGTSDGKAGLYNEASNAHQVGPGNDIRMNSLDTVLDGFDKVDLMKVDLEGMELNIFKHARHKNSLRWPIIVKRIVVEVHGEYRPEDCAIDLAALGYTKLLRLPHHYGGVYAER